MAGDNDRRQRVARLVTTGVLVAAMGTLACGDADPGVDHLFEIETVGGVEIVINRDGPRFNEQLFALDEQLTLVQDPGNEDSLLFRPRDFARGGDGNYYVADAGNGRIAVFSDAGEFLRGIGREGIRSEIADSVQRRQKRGPQYFVGKSRRLPIFRARR